MKEECEERKDRSKRLRKGVVGDRNNIKQKE